MNDGQVPVWTPADLHRHLADCRRFSILDVRNRDEFNAWCIEGKTAIDTYNIPYFELLDLEEEDEEIAAAVARAVPERLRDKLPLSGPTLVVCAKGDTSTHIAEGLRRLDYEAFNLDGGMLVWGNHYEVRPVVDGARLSIIQISRPARGCLSYIIASGGEALVVDPARHIEIYRRLLLERGWRLSAVLDTHLQADHLSGGAALAVHWRVDYWLHPYDSIHPEDFLPATFPFRYLQDGMTFTLGAVRVRVLHLPGHTLGMVNLLVDDGYLLAGDALFIDSIGRPDLGGRAETWTPLLYRSLRQLLALPDRTILLPAHFSHMSEADSAGCYRATVGGLRTHNQGLRALERGERAFNSSILASLPEQPERYDEIRRVNLGLLQVNEAEAGELELGRNRCALDRQAKGERQAA
ncbi:MAG: MBL fold metallo-hydrolase [Pseudomonadota bacterium]|nr:MBL fold metallo-hydrolase [Pseudomonadota bacterium]